MAHQTGTTLSPDTIPEKNWIEDKLLRIITRCFLTNLRDARYDILFELLPYFDAYIKNVSERSGLERSLTLVDALSKEIFLFISKPDDSLVFEIEAVESIGLADYLATLPITCILAFVGSQESDAGSRVQTQLLS